MRPFVFLLGYFARWRPGHALACPAMGRFLQCCNADALSSPCSVVHHMRHLPYGGVYLHHLALLRAMPGRFRVDWLSETFRWAAAAYNALSSSAGSGRAWFALRRQRAVLAKAM